MPVSQLWPARLVALFKQVPYECMPGPHQTAAYDQPIVMLQLNKALEDKDAADPTPTKKKRSIASAVGLGAAASMLMVQNAEAATQVAQLAESDSRVAVIGTLFLPVLGWVGFNMIQPALNQVGTMGIHP